MYREHNPRFKLSAYLQERLCWIGQECVFDKASEALEKLCQLSISDKQVERVCHYYGGLLEEEMADQIRRARPDEDRPAQADLTYAMLDGAQFLFREEGWKEAKLGRFFSAGSHLAETSGRNWIRDSTYVVHRGSSKAFLEKFSYYLEGVDKAVIIADGAPWIGDWADTFYSQHPQILDFYHAVEHLARFANSQIKQKSDRQTFLTKAKQKLLDDGIGQLIQELEDIRPASPQAQEELRKLLNYYKKHQKRMYYKSFQEKGYFIGSGAIEAAHRHVLQQRLKLSGQRWTKEGFQAVANLRACYKSKQQCKIKKWVRKSA